eukprot:s1944_g4.t1
MALVFPPAEVPADIKEDVEKLNQSVRTLLITKGIPWQVMARLATEGYVTMEDLADRWDTAATARTAAPAELGFAHNAHITDAQEKFVAMRIFQSVRHAKQLVSTLSGGPASPTKNQLAGGLDSLCDRKQLLANWDNQVKLPRPKLEFQGSDAYLKKQWKYCSQGEIGWFQIKHIVSALPEMDERPIKTRRQVTVNGWEREDEDEERKAPTTRDQLKRAHQVFRNTLLMCVISFPQFSQFDVKYQDLEDWYAFFWGKDIADRKPAPSESVLLYAERNAWREIHNRVYEGASLKTAMSEQKADTLFWQREVYERIGRASDRPTSTKGSNPGGKGKGKSKQPSWSPAQPQWSKGKPSKGKSQKGGQKGKETSWPKHWATTTPKGLQCPGGDTPPQKKPRVDQGQGATSTTDNSHSTPPVVPSANDKSGPYSTLSAEDSPVQTLTHLCPWIQEIPQRLRDRLPWQTQTHTPPDTRAFILVLYAGDDDELSLKSAMLAKSQHWPVDIREIDNKRPGHQEDHDMLRDQPYSDLCHLALQGKVRGLLGGPNCRTWSILRWFPKPNAPLPVRGRKPDLIWGLPSNTASEQEDTDNDSILLLRYLVLFTLAHEGAKMRGFPPPASFLEHPEDPVNCSNAPAAFQCSSIWSIHWLRCLLQSLGLFLIHFDQCRFGQWSPKPTTVATNLPLHHWNQFRCDHPFHPKPPGGSSSDLSRYPWPMMLGIATALLEADFAQITKPACHSTSHSDRPTSSPKTTLMSIQDDPVMVQLGFRTRPLRDGGGKPSWGRIPPALRPATPFPGLGERLRQLCTPFVQPFLDSIHQGDKQHPFPQELLASIRDTLAHSCSYTQTEPTVPHGQPFHLGLIGALAAHAQDPDLGYPQILVEGVPLGVSTPTLESPGIWPTKEELRGQEDPSPEYPPLKGRDNYPSAKEFTAEIAATFEEEKLMNMVLGPFTQHEAAQVCDCHPDELCPGPMAGIQESDKVRTIFDGTWGGANTHIQANTKERTTAPTVMDCVQALHWLHAVSQSASGSANGEQGDTSDKWSPPPSDTVWILLKADITKAHRRIKVLKQDWKYQVAQLGPEAWWVNTVGTYGMASAQLYWGRMAALLLRLVYYLFPDIDWGFVFVDDFCWILRAPKAALSSTTVLATLLALGVPLSWKKTVLSEINTWLGFVINPKTLFVRMGEDKHEIIMAILDKLQKSEVFTSKAIEKASF